jgi:addiction module HigA family antidote
MKGNTTMDMYDPPHPGEVIREECLEPLGLTVGRAADGLGVARKTLSSILNGHAAISPEMAIRFEKAGWSTADAWLRMQLQYDLWQARQRAGAIHVKPFAAAAEG